MIEDFPIDDLCPKCSCKLIHRQEWSGFNTKFLTSKTFCPECKWLRPFPGDNPYLTPEDLERFEQKISEDNRRRDYLLCGRFNSRDTDP